MSNERRRSKRTNRSLHFVNRSFNADRVDVSSMRNSQKTQTNLNLSQDYCPVINKQRLFGLIREHMFGTNPSEQLKSELDHQDRSYAREYRALNQSVNGALRNSFCNIDSSPVESRPRKRDENIQIFRFSSPKPGRKHSSQERNTSVAEPSRRTPKRTDYKKSRATDRVSASAELPREGLPKLEKRKYNLPPIVLYDIEQLKAPKESAHRRNKRPRSLAPSIANVQQQNIARQPPSSNVGTQFSKLNYPLNTRNSTTLKKVDNSVKFELLYSHFKNAKARQSGDLEFFKIQS